MSLKTFILCFIAGMTTGMGNGSVFGAAMMCFLGRGPFESWGGWGVQAYDPTTFQGFINWAMIVFGIAFVAIMIIGLKAHAKLEGAKL